MCRASRLVRGRAADHRSRHSRVAGRAWPRSRNAVPSSSSTLSLSKFPLAGWPPRTSRARRSARAPHGRDAAANGPGAGCDDAARDPGPSDRPGERAAKAPRRRGASPPHIPILASAVILTTTFPLSGGLIIRPPPCSTPASPRRRLIVDIGTNVKRTPSPSSPRRPRALLLPGVCLPRLPGRRRRRRRRRRRSTRRPRDGERPAEAIHDRPPGEPTTGRSWPAPWTRLRISVSSVSSASTGGENPVS